MGQGRDVQHLLADQGMGLAFVRSELCDLSTSAAAHDPPDLSAGATEDRDVRAEEPGVHRFGCVEDGQRDTALDGDAR